MINVADRTDATASQVKAVANPLRLRILRRCLLEPMTNKQLADWLECDPSTSLYHVRLLVAAGFLEPVDSDEVSAKNKPYRTTTLSWTLNLGPNPDTTLAMLDAFRAEVVAAGPESVDTSSRFVLHLGENEARQLAARLQDLLDEYVATDEQRRTNGQPPHGGMFMLHPLADI